MLDYFIGQVDREKVQMSIGSEMAAVKKPLIPGKRMTESGNVVAFGPKPEDNFVKNTRMGRKIMLQQRGKGSYVMEVTFVGGQKTEITVDSGAEESVCPLHWGEQFGKIPSAKTMKFRSASGGQIDHFGHRDVVVECPF